MRALPDFADVRLDHGLACFAGESFLELGEVGYDSVNAGEAGGVGVGEGVDAEVFGAVVLAGPLGHADPVALVGGEAVAGGEGLAGCLFLPGDVGEEGAADVGYVFSAGEFGVDVDVVDDDVGRVLVADAVDAVFEVFGVGWGPPVLEVAGGVELAAFVVEGVGELVADGGAGVAVVGGVVELDVVEGRLEDAGGEVDVVHLWVEVGVDGGRRHAPLVAVDGLAEFAPAAGFFEVGSAGDVAVVVVGLDLERGVVAPGVGVADLVADGVEFAEGFLFGVGAHPVEAFDLGLHGGLDLVWS